MADVKQEEKFIQLGKDNILRLKIRTYEGKETGEVIEIDTEDIEYPLRISESQKLHEKNLRGLQNKLKFIEQQPDKKGKFVLSWKDEEEYKAYAEFYRREMEAIDLIIGEGATKKLLNGRKPYLSMYKEISEILKNQIYPYLKVNMTEISNKIKEIYSTDKSDVIE